MSTARGLFKTENFAEQLDGFKFKEGFVRVDSSVYKVHQNRERKNDDGSTTPGEIKLAWVLGVTRFDEDMNPLKDEHDEDLTEEFVLSLGGKALAQAHPGKADSPEDEEVDDQGDEVNSEGNTIFMVNPDYKLHPSTASAKFMDSLNNAGWKEDYNRCWAPDYVGSVFFVKGEPNKIEGKVDKKGKPVEYDVKVVSKIVKAGYEVKSGGASKAAAKAGKSAQAAEKQSKGAGAEASGVAEKAAAAEKADNSAKSPSPAEAALKPILQKISEHYDGQRFTRKALVTKVNMALQNGKVEDSVTGKVEPKLHVPVMSLLKDDKWMTANSLPKSGDYDMTYDAEAGTVTFGTFVEG